MANKYTYSRSLDEYLNDNKAEVLEIDTPEADVLEEQTGLVKRNASKAEAQASQYDTTQTYEPFSFMDRYGEALVASHPSSVDAGYLGSRSTADMEARSLAISTFLEQNMIRNPELNTALRGPAVAQSSDMGVTAVTRTPNMTAPAMDEAPLMGRGTKAEEFVMTPDMEGVDTRADNTGAMGQDEAGLMEPNADIQPTVSTQATEPSVSPIDNSFFMNIGLYAESDHGSTPQPTNDRREANRPVNQRSLDIGFGHKITDAELRSGTIHGIPFKNEDGSYRELTEDEKTSIMMQDYELHANAAREAGWDRKLQRIGTSWEELNPAYQQVLTSLAYNVGGDKAGRTWTNVLTAARDQNVLSFARGIRRKDGGSHTAGMDNRAAKELYFAGLISGLSEVRSALPLANARQAGIPE